MEGTTPWHSEEPVERYDVLFPPLPDYVVHRTIGLGELKIGLSKRVPHDVDRDLLAALVSHRLELSLAYARKRYTDEPTHSRWLGLTDRIDRIFELGQSCFQAYVSQGLDLSPATGSYQELSMQFFYRNIGAFDVGKRLSESGYLCEVAVVLRAALEQFAFCARLWDSKGSEDLASIRPMNSLDSLKAYVPTTGRLYGLLSKYTHFEFDHHTHFFARSETQVFTVRQSSVLRAYSTHVLLVTMACIGKYVLAIAPHQFGTLPASVGKLTNFMDSVGGYFGQVSDMLPTDEILATFRDVCDEIRAS